MKPEEFYKKEFGDLDNISKESIIRLLNHFAKVLQDNKSLEFAMYLTGHDRETIEQMFEDWREGKK